MHKKQLKILILLILIVSNQFNAAFADEQSDRIFSVTPAFSFAWYP